MVPLNWWITLQFAYMASSSSVLISFKLEASVIICFAFLSVYKRSSLLVSYVDLYVNLHQMCVSEFSKTLAVRTSLNCQKNQKLWLNYTLYWNTFWLIRSQVSNRLNTGVNQIQSDLHLSSFKCIRRRLKIQASTLHLYCHIWTAINHFAKTRV